MNTVNDNSNKDDAQKPEQPTARPSAARLRRFFDLSPLFKGGARGQVLNNLIYDPGQRGVHYNLIAEEWLGHPYSRGQVVARGNVMRAGISTEPVAFFSVGGSGDVDVFLEDNLAVDRLGDDKAEVVGKAVVEASVPVGCGVGMAERGLHPYFQVAHFDGTGRHVIGPQIEGTNAREIEASIVPVARQDAVLDAAAVEQKPHVRTTIVECEDAPAVMNDKDRTMCPAHDETALGLQLLDLGIQEGERVARASASRCIGHGESIVRCTTLSMLLRSEALC